MGPYSGQVLLLKILSKTNLNKYPDFGLRLAVSYLKTEGEMLHVVALIAYIIQNR